MLPVLLPSSFDEQKGQKVSDEKACNATGDRTDFQADFISAHAKHLHMGQIVTEEIH